jgi:hypothetical protein
MFKLEEEVVAGQLLMEEEECWSNPEEGVEARWRREEGGQELQLEEVVQRLMGEAGCQRWD